MSRLFPLGIAAHIQKIPYYYHLLLPVHFGRIRLYTSSVCLFGHKPFKLLYKPQPAHADRKSMTITDSSKQPFKCLDSWYYQHYLAQWLLSFGSRHCSPYLRELLSIDHCCLIGLDWVHTKVQIEEIECQWYKYDASRFKIWYKEGDSASFS